MRFQFNSTTLFSIVTWACLTLGFIAIARAYPLQFGIVFGSLLFCLLVRAFWVFHRTRTAAETVFDIAVILVVIGLIVWAMLPRVR